MTIQDMQRTTQNDIHMKDLRSYIIDGYLPKRADVKQDMSPYLTFRDCYIYMLLVESCDRHSEINILLFPQLVYASP